MKIIKLLRPFGISIIAFLLYLIERGYVDDIINRLIIPITNVESSIPLAFITIIFIVISCYKFSLAFKNRRIISHDFQAWMLFLTLIYVYDRFFDETYAFTILVGNIAYSDFILIWPAYTIFASCKFWSRKKKDITGDKNDKQFIDDNPIRYKKEDLLNFGASVNKAYTYLKGTPVNASSFSIAITGQWGEGKTSFINLLKEVLVKSGDFIIVDFYPRSSKNKGNIQRDLLQAIRQELAKYHTGISSLMGYYIRALNLAKVYIPIVSILEEPSIEGRKETIEDALLKIGKKLIVFIDDTDRLTGEEIIEVLKLIDKNAAFKNTIFVTSMDKTHFDRSINMYLRNGINDAFADKYFSIEITLPQQPTYKRRDLLTKLLYQAIDNKNITVSNKKGIDSLIKNTSIFIDKYLFTIRDVKRFVNQFIYDYETIQNDVVLWDYFLLSLIKYRYKEEYDKLREQYYVELGSSMFGNYDDDIIYLKNWVSKGKSDEGEDVKVEIKDFPRCIDILRSVFPSQSNHTENWFYELSNRLYNRASFDFYFYDYESTHLRRDDFVRLFTLDYQDAVLQLKSWFANGYESDVSSYFLTRSLLTWGTYSHLERFFKLLLACNYYSKSTNYHVYLNQFFWDEDVEKIIRVKQYNITNKENWLGILNGWITDTLSNNPLIASKYILACYRAFVDEPNLIKDYAYNMEDFRDLNLSLFTTYMEIIESKNWNVDAAIQLGFIPAKEKDINTDKFKRDAEASSIMEKYISSYPDKFISRFVTHYYKTLGKGRSILILNPYLKDILVKDGILEEAIMNLESKQDYDDRYTLQFIKIFFEKYKSNNKKGVEVALSEDIKNFNYDAYYKAMTK